MRLLAQAFLRSCEEQGIALGGKTVLCALSGGRDSMALFHLCLKLGAEHGFAVAAAHYNHCLRETADRDEAFVRSFCEKKGVPLIVGRGDVAALAETEKTSVEDAARIMRYHFLEETADELGADFIATAHHADDNAETLLLHLLRGAGLQGLCGIPPVRGRIIRPLLSVDRAAINAYIAENSIPFVEDETNGETVYERNRLRHELFPLLEELSPGSTGRIATAAERLRADHACLERQAEELLPLPSENGETELSRSLLRSRDAAIAVRLVRLAARRFGIELTAAQADSVLALRTGAMLSLPDGVRAAAEKNIVRFYRVPTPPSPLSLRPGTQRWGEYIVSLSETDGEIESDENVIALRGDVGELTIAAWNGIGRLTVDNGSRTVKRLLADHGIGAPRQENRPAIFSGCALIAVFGAGVDLGARPFAGETKKVITLAKEDKRNNEK